MSSTPLADAQVLARVGFGRLAGIAFGLGTHLFFGWTVYHLFFFLRDGFSASAHFHPLWDVVLAIGFAFPHSLLLWPRTQKWIKRTLPAALYGCLFCVATCLSLWQIFLGWSTSSQVIWELTGWGRWFMLGCFYASWIALLYSIHLTGLGYQTGWTPWWYWVRGKKEPVRQFVARGAYAWLRHPVYLSFLGLIWFTPRMTWDHAILTAVWTVYIFLGSHFKDRRLVRYLGDVYREYQTRVPGYPFIFWGPLGRHPVGLNNAVLSQGKKSAS